MAGPGSPPPAIASLVVFDDEVAEDRHRESRTESRRRLRAVVAEALILQDDAEALLLSLRERPPLREVAPPGHRLRSRFVELREALPAPADPAVELPAPADPAVERHCAAVRAILHHHVLLLKTSLGFLVAEGRCERFAEELDGIQGLGAPARRLESIWAEVRTWPDPPTATPLGAPPPLLR